MPGLVLSLPSQVAEELVSEGLATPGSRTIGRRGAAAEALQYTLIVFNTTASVVTLLTAGRDAARIISTKLVHWRRAVPDPEPPHRYTLRAGGPGGSLDFHLDHAPDADALRRFLGDVFGDSVK
jgi:hypothetical protein